MPFPDLERRLRGRRAQALLALGAFFSILLVLVFVDPRTAPYAPFCPFHRATGLWCPGCGTGRALHALVHGDVLHAVRLNVLAVAAIPVFLALAIGAALRPERQLPVPPVWLRWAIYALLAFFLVARNLPFAPPPPLRSHRVRAHSVNAFSARPNSFAATRRSASLRRALPLSRASTAIARCN